jgi:hypothetical protein
MVTVPSMQWNKILVAKTLLPISITDLSVRMEQSELDNKIRSTVTQTGQEKVVQVREKVWHGQ